MNMLTSCLKSLFFAAAALAFRPASAQNNPVASSLVMSSLAPVANLNPAPAPEESAHFYDDTCKDLGHALAWMQEANAVQPKYWNLYTEARIHLKMQNYPAALATAIRARELAAGAAPANPAYVRLSDEVIRVARQKSSLPAAPAPAFARN